MRAAVGGVLRAHRELSALRAQVVNRRVVLEDERLSAQRDAVARMRLRMRRTFELLEVAESQASSLIFTAAADDSRCC